MVEGCEIKQLLVISLQLNNWFCYLSFVSRGETARRKSILLLFLHFPNQGCLHTWSISGWIWTIKSQRERESHFEAKIVIQKGIYLFPNPPQVEQFAKKLWLLPIWGSMLRWERNVNIHLLVLKSVYFAMHQDLWTRWLHREGLIIWCAACSSKNLRSF